MERVARPRIGQPHGGASQRETRDDEDFQAVIKIRVSGRNDETELA